MNASDGDGHAHLILLNGRVVTVDPRDTLCQAMAVCGERIARVGSNAEVLALRGPNTEVVDLEGKSVLPGLTDSHVHPLSAAMTEFDHPIPEMRRVAEVLAYVRQRAAALPVGEWIVISQVFITRLEELRYPTRAELDAAAPRHPVFFRTGPDASANTEALRRLGITRHTQAPPGSKVERDAAGEPTGILRGYAKMASLPPPAVRPATPQERYARLLALLHDYAAAG
ncbi:MAG: amidohydrolase family protein, partial [Armatimonadota bacterium]|nr:amidohydrolase family protein [Armatimonadota bacterium]